jgi:hypothetical protein
MVGTGVGAGDGGSVHTCHALPLQAASTHIFAV